TPPTRLLRKLRARHGDSITLATEGLDLVQPVAIDVDQVASGGLGVHEIAPGAGGSSAPLPSRRQSRTPRAPLCSGGWSISINPALASDGRPPLRSAPPLGPSVPDTSGPLRKAARASCRRGRCVRPARSGRT